MFDVDLAGGTQLEAVDLTVLVRSARAI